MVRSRISTLAALAAVVVAATTLCRNGPFAPALQLKPPIMRKELQSGWRRRAAVATRETMSTVAQVVSTQLGVDKSKVTGCSTFSALGADSLDVVETVVALEEQFEVDLPDAVDIELPDVGTARLKTMQDLADLIQGRFDTATQPPRVVAMSS
jgi:acyl carrier protein